jgi:hypothetical protein
MVEWLGHWDNTIKACITHVEFMGYTVPGMSHRSPINGTQAVRQSPCMVVGGLGPAVSRLGDGTVLALTEPVPKSITHVFQAAENDGHGILFQGESHHCVFPSPSRGGVKTICHGA